MRWAAETQLQAAKERRGHNEALLAVAVQESRSLAATLEVERTKADAAKAAAVIAANAAEEASRSVALATAALATAEAERVEDMVDAKVSTDPHPSRMDTPFSLHGALLNRCTAFYACGTVLGRPACRSGGSRQLSRATASDRTAGDGTTGWAGQPHAATYREH